MSILTQTQSPKIMKKIVLSFIIAFVILSTSLQAQKMNMQTQKNVTEYKTSLEKVWAGVWDVR